MHKQCRSRRLRIRSLECCAEPQHDAFKRRLLIENLAKRPRLKASHDFEAKKSRSNNVIMKSDFHFSMKRMQLKREVNGLVGRIRRHVGPSFLEGNRTIIACIVPKNLFVDDYKLNFPPNVSYEQDAGRG